MGKKEKGKPGELGERPWTRKQAPRRGRSWKKLFLFHQQGFPTPPSDPSPSDCQETLPALHPPLPSLPRKLGWSLAHDELTVSCYDGQLTEK